MRLGLPRRLLFVATPRRCRFTTSPRSARSRRRLPRRRPAPTARSWARVRSAFPTTSRGALAGGICCGITHGALTPVDVVKTRIQLDPVKYNQGFIGGFKQVIEGEGAGALLTGLGPTAQGYFIQGWFKFGGVEYFKINLTQSMGEQAAELEPTSIYLLASACPSSSRTSSSARACHHPMPRLALLCAPARLPPFCVPRHKH